MKNHTPPTWNDLKWELPSLAVIACAEDGNGCILWTAGPHLAFELRELDYINNLHDLGLSNAPIGISIWEGVYKWEYPEDGSTSPSGKFRNPTAEEWTAICAGQCPWDEQKWKEDPIPVSSSTKIHRSIQNTIIARLKALRKRIRCH